MDISTKCFNFFISSNNTIYKKRYDYSLYLFSKENIFRKFCSYITLHKWYETAILFFVALNCITLALERPSILESSLVSILNFIQLLKRN